jgi:hypothetical protein
MSPTAAKTSATAGKGPVPSRTWRSLDVPPRWTRPSGLTGPQPPCPNVRRLPAVLLFPAQLTAYFTGPTLEFGTKPGWQFTGSPQPHGFIRRQTLRDF